MKRLTILLCLAASSEFAEDDEQMSSEVRVTPGDEHGKNHIDAIVGYAQKSGATDGPTGGRRALIYGVEYQYRVHDRFSLGIFLGFMVGAGF